MLALDIASPEQVAISSSTRIGHSSLQSQYQIAPQWTTIENLSYTQIDYYGSTRVDQVYNIDFQLVYDIWRNMTLAWEYSYTDIQSNAPGSSAMRNYFTMSTNYRF